MKQLILLAGAILFASVAYAQPLPDHLQCHKVKDTQKFREAQVTLDAVQIAFQMPENCTIKGKGREFCVPVIKTVVASDAPGSQIGPGQDLSLNDYVCYKMKCPKTTHADELVADQFGVRVLEKIKAPKRICVPAVKGTPPTTIPCVPDCTGLQCGDDGCGGSCGTCAQDETCVGGICEPPAPTCGDDVVNQPSEECDGIDDGECPGQCQVDCTCPSETPECGDGLVNDPTEECDPPDDTQCPSLCKADCTCAPEFVDPRCCEFFGLDNFVCAWAEGEQGCFDLDGVPGDPGTACDAASGLCVTPPLEGGDCCDGVCGFLPTDTCCVAGPGGDPATCNALGGRFVPDAVCLVEGVCAPATCGDDITDPAFGEECDGTDDFLCPGQCAPNCVCPVLCGNDFRQPGEQCDGSDDVACPGLCQVDCTCLPFCGDNIVNQESEQCDGEDNQCPDEAGCLIDCTCAVCGNDIVEPGEQCDGTDNEVCPGQCDANCLCVATPSICGDSAIEGDETCDPPFNQGGEPGCDDGCQYVCGDGLTDPGVGEECDSFDDSACPNFCQADCLCIAPQCGDNVVNQPNEECDGTDDEACLDGCGESCVCNPVCGDGAVNQPNEECDGADDEACLAGCGGSCVCLPTCGDDVVNQPSEECDGSDDTACPGLCQVDCVCGAICGDGICTGNESAISCAADCACTAGNPDSCGVQAPGGCFCDAACDLNNDCCPDVCATCGVVCPPVCGDDVVNQPAEQCDGPDDSICPGQCEADCTCAGGFCGDGVVNQPSEQCDSADDNTCPGRCNHLCVCVPAEWTCLEALYGTNDGCDCGCGVVDPDCADATASSCQYCDNPGACSTSCEDIEPNNNAVCISP